MISNLSNWARNIIIVTLIGTIIEMILPDNKNKKYVKVFIGVYILICIITPFTCKNINISDYNIEKYINSTDEDNKKSTNDSTKKVYKEKVIENIKDKLKLSGYDSNDIQIEINSNYTIKSININGLYDYQNNDTDDIKKVVIGEKKGNKVALNIGEKNKIIQDLSNSYQIDQSFINIE